METGTKQVEERKIDEEGKKNIICFYLRILGRSNQAIYGGFKRNLAELGPCFYFQSPKLRGPQLLNSLFFVSSVPCNLKLSHFPFRFSVWAPIFLIFLLICYASLGTPEFLLIISNLKSFFSLPLQSFDKHIMQLKSRAKNTILEIKLFQDHQMKDYFLKDLNSDIFVVLQNKIFPLHLNILGFCLNLQLPDPKSSRFFFLDVCIQIPVFEKLLASMYGYPLQIASKEEAIKILQAGLILGIQKINDYFLEELSLNFEEYQFFSIYTLAYRYKIKWLQQKCFDDLVQCQFEHLRIYRFQLMEADAQTFRRVLKQYQIWKKNNFSNKDLKKIEKLLSDYSTYHSTQIELEEILSISEQQFKNTANMIEILKGSTSSQKNRREKQYRRKYSWDDSLSPDKRDLSLCSSTTGVQSLTEAREINKNILEKSDKMREQIKQIQKQISGGEEQFRNRICKMAHNLTKIMQNFESQERKLENLKNTIQTL